MPIIKSAKKAARQAVKRKSNNEAIKKAIRTSVKTLRAEPSFENFKKAQSEIDKACKKGLLKKNTASRRKARIAKIAKEAGMKIEKAKKPAAKKATKKSEDAE